LEAALLHIKSTATKYPHASYQILTLHTAKANQAPSADCGIKLISQTLLQHLNLFALHLRPFPFAEMAQVQYSWIQGHWIAATLVVELFMEYPMLE